MPEATADPNNTKNISLIVLATTTIFFGCPALLSLGFFVILPMMFDAPGSENDPRVWGMALSVASFPCLTAISVTGSWFLFALKRYRAAVIISFIPLLSVCILVGGFVYASISGL